MLLKQEKKQPKTNHYQNKQSYRLEKDIQTNSQTPLLSSLACQKICFVVTAYLIQLTSSITNVNFIFEVSSVIKDFFEVTNNIYNE